MFSAILETLTEIKSYVTQEIEHTVHDIVFHKLAFESHEALIELSSQTIVEHVYVEDYWLLKIEPSLVIFEGKGYVECELNYGSKHDGVAFCHNVPFSFMLASSIDNIENVDFYEQGMFLDNSSFYK
ncbi:MAG: pPIWI-associating nuclease domain-containing protein [Methylobacter sp.]